LPVPVPPDIAVESVDSSRSAPLSSKAKMWKVLGDAL
jgi:hypothetical protein